MIFCLVINLTEMSEVLINGLKKDHDGWSSSSQTRIAVYNPDVVRRVLKFERGTGKCRGDFKENYQTWKHSSLLLETGPYILLFWFLYYSGQFLFYSGVLHRYLINAKNDLLLVSLSDPNVLLNSLSLMVTIFQILTQTTHRGKTFWSY